MTRDEAVTLLTNVLTDLQPDTQKVEGTGEIVTALVTQTGRPVLTLGAHLAEIQVGILKQGGGVELATFLADLLLEQAPCILCPPRREEPSVALVGLCSFHVESK